MSDRLPFDPVPRPGEVAGIVARARRRKAVHAALPLSVVVGVALVASMVGSTTPRADQRIEIADDPLTAVTEIARPTSSASPARPFEPGVRPAPTPSGVVLPPPVGPSPTSSRTPPPQPTRSPRPGERRPYRGELGPRVEEYAYPRCRQAELEPGSRTQMHAAFCIQWTFAAPAATGVSDLAPAVRLCYQAETVYNGRLEFPTQEEADFALYVADVDDAGRTVPGRKLYRFSDTVAYRSRAHYRTVLQGDCFVWQARIDFDRARYGDGDFLLRLETKTTTFDPAYRVYDIAFSA